MHLNRDRSARTLSATGCAETGDRATRFERLAVSVQHQRRYRVRLLSSGTGVAVYSGGPKAGVDWASETHVGCVVGDDGAVVDRFDIAHDASGLKQMVRRFRAAAGT
jgi:hypothetical protein